ncbi:Uma2 family endonuclease [Oscillospiraceae bacterium 42-9]|uniref:Uma2 family endonuclease n=1 Tax=Acutalibacter sp. 1XD8-36 TaxID=2320852 RepID=UPI0014135581|nr:Uma2 family endonuclease [Acutalibacter sp. 1XD8-36]NBJ90177.1 Uma2 family endonuclease [Acutalibacter sp. 1XD8-36]
MTTPIAQEKDCERYSYADYLQWNAAERCELIEGETVLLAAPSTSHQRISMEISRQLANFLEGKNCEAFAAPFDVRLFEKDNDAPEDVDTVVQPDITVVCDRAKLDERGCKGAPDMVIEILSPGSLRHDRLVKMDLYQRAGVGELWLVDPANRAIQVFLLKGGVFQPYEDYGTNDIAKVNSLDGCFIEVGKVFQ